VHSYPTVQNLQVRQNPGVEARRATTICPALLDKRQLYPNNGLRCFSWSELGKLAPRPRGRWALSRGASAFELGACT
jgi:hypothetical protein